VSTSRRVSAEPADLLRAGVPLLLLVGAVALPSLAGPFLVALVGGVAVAAGRRVPVAWAWAAMVPAAITATIRAFGPAAAAWDGPACAGVLSPPVPWSVTEAAIVVAATVGLAGALGSRGGDVGARRPPRYAIRWAITGAIVILGAGLAGVILLARPVFGPPDVQLGGLGFVLPSGVFALSIALAEEVAWRGAMQGWLAKTLGPWTAVLLQSLVYGLASGVLLGSPLLGVLAGAAGMVLGASVVRTRTLLVALAWHAAFNVPFFVFLACRVA
jgi:membrane protease YdiL (CAAX protease family)